MAMHTVEERGLSFKVARYLISLGDKVLSDVHVEGAERLREVKAHDKKAIFLYASLHKSLWETTGIPSAIYSAGLPVPYPCMGDNLVKGKIAQKIARRLGLFIIPKFNDNNHFASTKNLILGMQEHFDKGKDILIFPETSRKGIVRNGVHGQFFPACFLTALNYQAKSLSDGRQASNPYDIHIVPVNVDYSKVKDANDLLRSVSRSKTMKFHDLFKTVFKTIGDVYISFGEPIRAGELEGMKKKELAALVRDECLDLVKILPINVAAEGLLRSPSGAYSQVLKSIAEARDLLLFKSRNFRGFTIKTEPDEIYRLGKGEKLMKDIGLTKLYASYIRHYLPTTSFSRP